MSKSIVSRGSCLAAVISLLLSVTACYAGWFDKHPGYRKAVGTLSDALKLIEHPDPKNAGWDQSKAVSEINACIKDVKKAALNDGQELVSESAPDIDVDFHARMHVALDLLDKSRRDIDKEADDADNTGLQARAVGHVDTAMRLVKKAIGDKPPQSASAAITESGGDSQSQSATASATSSP